MSYVTILTTAGIAKVATAIATSTPLPLTQMAVGDGNGNPTTPTAGQTSLVREKFRGPIAQAKIDPANANRMIFDLQVPAAEGGWPIHEVGLFDNTGTLIAVANFPATYKPLPSEGSTADLTVRIYVQLSNASAVTVSVDPAIVIASQAWVIANFSLPSLIPGGTTNQVLRKHSNANGDVEWADPLVVSVIVNVVKEIQTLTAGQTVVNLATCTTVGLAMYIEGAREDDFTVNSATQITLGRSYPTGTRVQFYQNEPTNEADLLTRDGGTMKTGAGIEFDGGRVTGLSTPVDPDEPATKGYVDARGFIGTAIMSMQNTSLTVAGGIGSTQDIPWDSPPYNTAGVTVTTAQINLPANGVYEISGFASFQETQDYGPNIASFAAVELWDVDGNAQLDIVCSALSGISGTGTDAVIVSGRTQPFSFIVTVGSGVGGKNIKLRAKRLDASGGYQLIVYGRSGGVVSTRCVVKKIG